MKKFTNGELEGDERTAYLRYTDKLFIEYELNQFLDVFRKFAEQIMHL